MDAARGAVLAVEAALVVLFGAKLLWNAALLVLASGRRVSVQPEVELVLLAILTAGALLLGRVGWYGTPGQTLAYGFGAIVASYAALFLSLGAAHVIARVRGVAGAIPSDGAATPEGLKEHALVLARLLDADPTTPYEPLHAALVNAGADPADAELLFCLLPIAAGRALLGDEWVTYAQDFLVQDPDSGGRQSHQFAASPHYAAVVAALPALSPTSWRSVAHSSAEVDAVFALWGDPPRHAQVHLVEPVFLTHWRQR